MLFDQSGRYSYRLRFERIWLIAKMDFVQRYYGSGLGLLWALLNPLLRIIVYYLVFTFFIYRNAQDNFILYLFIGLTIWQYFAENTNKGMALLKSKKYLIQNVEINKVDIYVASALSTMFSFFLSLAVYFIFVVFFDISYSWQLVLILPLFLTLFFIVIGVSMVLSCLVLYLKDLQHLWDLALLAGMWTLPIFWDYNIVLENFRSLLYINPLCGVLINMRYILLYNQPLDWHLFLFNFAYALCLLGLGLVALRNFSYKAVENH